MVNADPRAASPGDLPKIEELLAASFEKYLPRMDRPPAPLVRDYAEAIEKQQVWIVGEPPQGVVVLVDHTETALLIETVAVHPSAQGSGLGRQLIEFAEAQATAGGFNHLALYTNEAMIENPPLYERLGFTEVDRRIEDGYRRIYMEKVL